MSAGEKCIGLYIILKLSLVLGDNSDLLKNNQKTQHQNLFLFRFCFFTSNTMTTQQTFTCSNSEIETLY